MHKAAAGEDFRMVDDQTSVPTPADFLAEQTVALIESDAMGLLHMVPSGQATRFEFACEVVRAMASRSRVDTATSDHFATTARRPPYSVLDNTKAAGMLGRPIPSWKSVLLQCK